MWTAVPTIRNIVWNPVRQDVGRKTENGEAQNALNLSASFYLTPKQNQHPTMLQAEQTDTQLAMGFVQSEP